MQFLRFLQQILSSLTVALMSVSNFFKALFGNR